MVTTSNFGLYVLLVMIIDGPGHRESTERPINGPLRYMTEAKKIIRDSRIWEFSDDFGIHAAKGRVSDGQAPHQL